MATVSCCSLLVACGGGGGGGGGGSSSGGSVSSAGGSSTTRSTKTGVRIINASIDLTPVTISAGGADLQTARYAQLTNFVSVPEGPHTLTIARANEPTTIVTAVSQDLASATEYSVLLYGATSRGELGTAIIADPVSRPESGHYFFRLVHAFNDIGAIKVSIAGQTLGPITLGQFTALVDIPSGEQTAVISTASGFQLASVTFTATDRGEGALVLTGSNDLGAKFTPLYVDLD